MRNEKQDSLFWNQQILFILKEIVIVEEVYVSAFPKSHFYELFFKNYFFFFIKVYCYYWFTSSQASLYLSVWFLLSSRLSVFEMSIFHLLVHNLH